MVTLSSFSWKRKIGETVSKTISSSFESTSKEDNEYSIENNDLDLLSMLRPAKEAKLESGDIKSKRLTDEGVFVAEQERYWEAITKWDEAISLTPYQSKIHEMKAQALLALLELYPAVESAKLAVLYEPTWWIAYQTLGRIHVSMGELNLAARDFQKALHLNPQEETLWTDDLEWTLTLLKVKSQRDQIAANESAR